MKSTDIEQRVRQMVWPAPSDDLRTRILAAAPVQHISIAWSDRVWFSREWRFSMAAATMALLLVQVLSSGLGGTVNIAPTSRAVAEAQAIEETGSQIGLPAELAAELARRVSMERATRGPLAGRALELLDLQGELR
jgi:hypothetical protein